MVFDKTISGRLFGVLFALTITLSILALVKPALAQDASLSALEVQRDCSVTNGIGITWGASADAGIDRYEIFSRSAPDQNAEWRGFKDISEPRAYTFPGSAGVAEQFQIALKKDGQVSGWGQWYALDDCAGGSGDPVIGDSGSDDPVDGDPPLGGDAVSLPALEVKRDCGVTDGVGIVWGASADSQIDRYEIFSRSAPDQGAVWRGFKGISEPRAYTFPDSAGAAEQFQIAVKKDGQVGGWGQWYSLDDCGGGSGEPVCSVSDGVGSEVDGSEGNGTFNVNNGDWTRHPWSHDFDTVADLEHWHAPHRIGGRDPDDRHVGKQIRTATGILSNREQFDEFAYVDTATGELVMKSTFDGGEARMPYLVSYAAFDTLDFDTTGNEEPVPVYWSPDTFPRSCVTSDGQQVTLPCDLLLDPTQSEYYIETNVTFEQAIDAYKTWWAFWLFSREKQYDGNVDTGMEVDLLEYVPYAATDGFNAALFRDDVDQTETSVLHPPLNECRPEDTSSSSRCDTFTANSPDTDAFLRAANRVYDACRANDSCPKVELDRGYHRIGLRYSRTAFTFYLDGYKFWEVTDPSWITKLKELGIQLTWEKDEGGVIKDENGNGVLDYLDDRAVTNTDNPRYGLADGVADWRRSAYWSPLSYGVWNQGFLNPVIYNGTCLVVDIGKADGEQYTIEEARARAINGNDMEIVSGSCSLKTHKDHYTSQGPAGDSIVRVDYVHLWTKN